MPFHEGISVGTQHDGRALPLVPQYQIQGRGLPRPSPLMPQRYTFRRCPMRTTWIRSPLSMTS